MRKNTYVILFIFLASVLAAGCSSTDGSGVKDVKASENIGSDGNVQEQTAVQEQAAAPAKGSFKNPASIGETVTLSAPGGTYEVSIIEVKRSTDANYVVKSANQFNQDPATGYEYLLVKARVAFTVGEKPTGLSSTEFKVFCNGVECQESWVVLPKDYIKFGTGDVMPGATKEGWITYTVPTGSEAILSYQPNMFDESTAYISLGK